MDGDPTVEPELDAFSLFLPLPYRVALIIVLGRASCFRDLLGQSLIGLQAFGHGA